MPKLYMYGGNSVKAMRQIASESEKQRRIDACRTCRAIHKWGINSAEICVELGIDASRLPAWLLGHEKMHKSKGEHLPREYTIAALEKLPQEGYEAKRKAIRLALHEYSYAKKSLCCITGDKLPKYWDESPGAEKLRTPFSEADFQELAVAQLKNVAKTAKA